MAASHSASSSSDKTPQRRRYSRADHRARSHESAHAEGPVAESPSIDNPLVPSGPAGIVTQPDQLHGLVDHLRSVGSFGYDSEFIGELTYFPKLCLIQVASSQRVALIDPLAGLDLAPFWELLCDPAVEKIAHACQQDVEPVVRHLDRQPANIFDTQVAAAFAGLPYPVSLSKLVYELTGARLGKGLTFSHWDQRPLSAMQLRYAADDVRYLPLVRQTLRLRLEALGHERWAREECATLCDAELYRFDPKTQYLRVRGAGSLQPRNLAVLRELTIWRDAAARAADVPPRAFLKDEVLIDLARNPVTSVEKLDRVRGLPRPVEAEHGPEIVAVSQRALDLPAEALPAQRDTEQSPSEKFRTDALWAAAQCLCAGRSIDPALVTSRQEIVEFTAHVTRPDAAARPPRLLAGWRRDCLGDPLTRLLQGNARLTAAWRGDSLNAKME